MTLRAHNKSKSRLSLLLIAVCLTSSKYRLKVNCFPNFVFAFLHIVISLGTIGKIVGLPSSSRSMSCGEAALSVLNPTEKECSSTDLQKEPDVGVERSVCQSVGTFILWIECDSSQTAHGNTVQTHSLTTLLCVIIIIHTVVC